MALFPTASASVCQIHLTQSGSFSNTRRAPSGTSGELRGRGACDQNGVSGQGTPQMARLTKYIEGWRLGRSRRKQEVGDEMEGKNAKCGMLKKLGKMRGLNGAGQSIWEQEAIWKAKEENSPHTPGFQPHRNSEEDAPSPSTSATLALSYQSAPFAAHRGNTHLYTAWLCLCMSGLGKRKFRLAKGNSEVP